MLSAELREFALSPDRFTRIAPPTERYDDGTVCVVQGTTWAAVSGIRSDDLRATLELAREVVPADKYTVWWIADDCRPTDAYERLRELGLRDPRDRSTYAHVLASVDAPEPGPADVLVTQVRTFEEFVQAAEIGWAAFETPDDRREAQRPHLQEEFDSMIEHGVPATFIAWLDDRPAGIGRSLYADRGVFIIAGAVLPHARGRGAYRALVRARWEDAVSRGTPALVTEAKPDTSYPILKRLGFVDVGIVRRLEDPR